MADVASNLYQWSTTAASNSPSGNTTIGTGLDDNLREIQAVVRAALAHKGADIASAGTTDLGAVAGLMHDITGTTTITGFGTVSAGIWKIVKFEGALTLTHNATSLILPGAANITTANGDIAIFVSEGSGNWRCVSYFAASPVIRTLNGQYPFPATQNASSNANTLDDYEEGSWTPTIGGASTPGTQTYTKQVGWYLKIGQLVVASWRIVLSAKDAGSAGTLVINGFPFTSISTSDFQASAAWGEVGSIDFSAGYTQIAGIMAPNVTQLILEQIGDNAAAAVLTVAAFGATSQVDGTISYRASA